MSCEAVAFQDSPRGALHTAPVAASVARAEASSMETFLAALARSHGGAHGWARAAGLGDDVLDALREVLVEAPRA